MEPIVPAVTAGEEKPKGVPTWGSPRGDDAVDDTFEALVARVTGCRDGEDGVDVKKHLVMTHVATHNSDVLGVICMLHERKVVVLAPDALLEAISFIMPSSSEFTKAEETAKAAAAHPGFFLATVLKTCPPAQMRATVQSYLESNDKLDAVNLIAYVAARGFVSYDKDALLDVDGLVSWAPPPPDETPAARWRSVWAQTCKEPPSGKPWFGTLAKRRGGKCRIAFLGEPTADTPKLARPKDVTRMWKLPPPSMLISADAGSMHPTQCDSMNRMAHLPQHFEWLGEQNKGKGDQEEPVVRKPKEPTPLPQLMQKSILEWQEQLEDVELTGDGSINNLIFTKLTEVFAAMVDAATLAGNWIIVDRTDGSGSATAELLLEMALQRGTTSPTIIVIDSLERLGNAADGSRSQALVGQLASLYATAADGDYSTLSQEPNGSEVDFSFDFRYDVDDFSKQSDQFKRVPDAKLPFPVLPDHKRKNQNMTCDPNRKWRYFYVDALFRSGTHIVIKNNDRDEFNVEELGPLGFLYAHGDSRTYKRLRANIQLGKPIVMLHNSGGVVTAFSWLQRVMKHMRPPPLVSELQGPLRYLIANLSAANWTLDFGVPEIIMMRSLAERAPMLFRKNVVSVDVLTESEEQVLEVITGCFAQSGGVPELGLGNAEVNVIFNTWWMHLTLCENAHRFHRNSVIAQWLLWILGVAATTAAVLTSSFGAGIIAMYLGHIPFPDERRLAEIAALPLEEEGPAAVCRRLLYEAPYTVHALMRRSLVSEEDVGEISRYLTLAVTILPIILALGVTIVGRMNWRDRWSVTTMCADQLTSEIYKFRMQTCEYDMNKPPGFDEDGNELPPLSQKEKARRARMLFVERVQAFRSACATELSQTSTLKVTRILRSKKVAPKNAFVERARNEEKPTLAQWYKLKCHIENHCYRAQWAFPVGVSFLTWMSALRPYLSQKSMAEEMKDVLIGLVDSGRIVLQGTTPLSESDSTVVRQALCAHLGLQPKQFDGVKDDIRVLQRKVVLQIADEAEKKAAEVLANVDGGEGVVPAGESTPQADVEAGAVQSRVPPGPKALLAKVLPAPPSPTAEIEGDEGTMRNILMEMQGLGKPKEDEGETLKRIKKSQKKLVEKSRPGRDIDDDYLCGPMTVDTYMCYRVRPTIARLQYKVGRLVWRLSAIQIAGFFVQASGSVFAIFFYSEWVALTVAVTAVLQGFIEFMKLHNQVTAGNLALRDMQALTVLWDSLSIVRRRTPAIKMQIVSATEAAILMVVQERTTAASNTITSVAKQMEAEAAAEAEAAEAE